jgi:hypothetical protein
MDLKELLPNGKAQRAYCSRCKGPLDLVFRRFCEEVSGVEIDIDGLPMLWCEPCDLVALPDRTRDALVRSHRMAVEAGRSQLKSHRRKIKKDFGFTKVSFLYDPDDYFYYPGLQRPFDVGFLTPVFFNRRVLSKYDADPNYAIRFASPTYGDIVADGFTIPFGVNRHGHLLMWLGDIAKLPEAVARWASGMCRRCRGNALEVTADA